MEQGHDVKAALSIYMQTLDTISFTSTLKSTHLPLTMLQEPSGMNIFHDIADCVVKESYLIEYLEILKSEFSDRYFDASQEMIKSMLNQHGGRDRLTPLMCAVRHNRKQLLKQLVALGGDFWRKDANGQSLVHMAAAHGFDSILVYLCFVLKMSYVENEKNGRSPLHMACLENQVITGMLLIVWNEELDLQDVEDFTPLHLAVLSSSYKLVRNLVIMGADMTIKDKKGETALDIALNRGDASIIKILVNCIQEEKDCMFKINPFKQKVGPVSNSYVRLVLFILLSAFRAGVICTIILPRMDFIISIPSVGLFLISMLGFFIACCKDPGYTKNNKNKTIVDYFEKYRGEYVCPYCEIRKPRHARHCHYCQRCIKEFDHHCPWIHNCVGKNNHFWFMIFVTFSMLDELAQISISTLDYLHYFQGHNNYLYELPEESRFVVLGVAALSFCFFIFVFPVWVMQIVNMVKAPSKKNRSESKVRDSFASVSELSDTGSMLLKPSSDWNPTSFQNQTSFLFTRKNTHNETSCC